MEITMIESSPYFDSIALLQQQLESEKYNKISMFQAIAIWLSEGLKEQEKVIEESNISQINNLQG
jgi:hypothetical protein